VVLISASFVGWAFLAKVNEVLVGLILVIEEEHPYVS
jgi:hypothetical protein